MTLCHILPERRGCVNMDNIYLLWLSIVFFLVRQRTFMHISYTIEIYITIECISLHAYILYLNGGIILELSWLENPANTYMRHTKHWIAVSTLVGLISSVYRDLHHWRSNQQPLLTEAETLPLGHRFVSHISHT